MTKSVHDGDKGPDSMSGTAVIVHPELDGVRSQEVYVPALEDQLEEAAGLARAIFLDVIGIEHVRVRNPVPGYLISKGKREEVNSLLKSNKPDVVIVNHTLSPVQQRNLEKEWNVKVIDRTGLILEIFGERAQTKEGKIQVELAALEYQRSRLVKSWTHLERQRGSTGFIGGPGETQIEIDRRLIGERITRLKKDLVQVRKNRELQRRSREQVPFPIVALVGYTNAGKSTLFNFITGANVYAEDLPFATLDPTMRKKELENGQDIILSDTVGFIADLPTHLVAAFRATLEQLQFADVIIHVRDISRPDHEAHKKNVIDILEDLGIHYEQDARIIEAWNKIDALAEDDFDDLMRKAKFTDNVAAISARRGSGVDYLLEMVEGKLSALHKTVCYCIPASDGRAIAWLYEHANVLDSEQSGNDMVVEVEISPDNLGRFTEHFSYNPERLENDNEKRVHDSKY